MPLDEVFNQFFSELCKATGFGVVEMTVDAPVFDSLEHMVRYSWAARSAKYQVPPPAKRQLTFVTPTGDVLIKRGLNKCSECGCEKHAV